MSKKRHKKKQPIPPVPPEYDLNCPEYYARLKREAEERERALAEARAAKREQRRQENRRRLQERQQSRKPQIRTSCIKRSGKHRVQAEFCPSYRRITNPDGTINILAIPLNN